MRRREARHTLEVDAPFMSSGDTAGPAVTTLKNAGTVDGATLGIVFSYAESDGSPNGSKTDGEVAAMLEVVALDCGDSGLGLDSIAHTNDNGYKDVQDLAGFAFTGLIGIAARTPDSSRSRSD